MLIDFEIPGIPRPQGSKRHVGNGIMIESSKHVKNWRAVASLCAMEAMADTEMILKPNAVRVTVAYYFPRPKKHSTKKAIRDGLPVYHTSTPDVDKLLRATLDSMTQIVFEDDSQVLLGSCLKLYSERALTRVRVEVM